MDKPDRIYSSRLGYVDNTFRWKKFARGSRDLEEEEAVWVMVSVLPPGIPASWAAAEDL